MREIDRLKELMAVMGLTKYKLSKLTGISPTTITNWLEGKTAPDRTKLEIVALKLKLPADYFWAEDKPDSATKKDIIKIKLIGGVGRTSPRYGTGSKYRAAVRRYAQTTHRIEKLRTGLFSDNVTNATLLECIKELTEENLKLHKQLKSMATTPTQRAQLKRISKSGPDKITG